MPVKEKIIAVLYFSTIVLFIYLMTTQVQNTYRGPMADINLALPKILKHEGGYSNVSGDSGGETYRGISRNNFPNWEGWSIVDQYKPLKDEQLIPNEELDSKISKFYKVNFWDALKLDSVKSQEVATKIFDMAVNMGTHRAVILVQQVLVNNCREAIGIDGRLGPETLRCINRQQSGYLVGLLKERCKKFYTSLAEEKPHLKKFLKNWLWRAAQ